MHDGIVPDTALPARQLAFKGSAAAASKPAPSQGARNRLPSRPPHLRWPLRQQRLAAGIAQAAHQAHLGQRRHRQPAHRRAARFAERGPGRSPLPGLARSALRSGFSPDIPTIPSPFTLGYGRTSAGRVGNGVGFNAYALRASDAPWFGSGLDIVKTGGKYTLATTQEHHLMEGRAIVISGGIEEYRKNPGLRQRGRRGTSQRTDHLSRVQVRWLRLGHDHRSDRVRRMQCLRASPASRKTTSPSSARNRSTCAASCTGCASIATTRAASTTPRFTSSRCPACSAKTRPASWCVPCKPPIIQSEGLNDMVYNRCVGTRYCSQQLPV